MRILCIGGGPAGLYFALLMKRADPRHAVRVVERNRAVRHVRLGRRLLRPDARQPRRSRPRHARRRSSAPSTTGTTSRSTSRAARSRPAATASAASAASGCSTSCSSAARSSASSSCSRPTSTTSATQQPRSTPTSSSPRDGLNSRIRERYAAIVRARHRPAATAASSGSARKKRFDGVHVRVRGDAARLVPGARLPVRRRHVDVHRRDARSTCGRRAGLDRMSQEEEHRVLRAAVRAVSRRPRADVERGAPARLGEVDPLSARRLPHVGALGRRTAIATSRSC